MDRVTKYFGSLVQETDLLQSEQNAMAALGWESHAAFGVLPNNNPSTFVTAVDGFTCTPTTPASLNVLLTPGAVYQYEPLEATLWSSMPINTAQSIVKQGLMLTSDSISISPPSTVGFSQVYLIEVQYQDLDTNPVLLPYFNPASPAQPFSGPANNGQAQNTARQGIAAVQLKAGVAAATGTQVAPTADAGWTGIFTVTVAQGQATVTSGNIAIVNSAPWIPTKLPSVPNSVLNGNWVYCVDTGGVNTYVANVNLPGFTPAALTAGMQVRVKIANANTGASTFNFNGIGAASIVRASGSALQANDLAAGEIVSLTYDGTHWQITNFTGTTPGTTNNNNFITGLPYVVDTGTVNNIVAPFTPAIGSTNAPSYTAGLAVVVKLANTVTGPTKITVNAFAQTNVVMPDGSAINSGDLKAGMELLLIYDGVNFQVASWQDAVSPLKMIALAPNGSQTFSGSVYTTVTSLTSVMQNTLVSSTWDGTKLTIGTGEDGLWTFFTNFELGNPTTALGVWTNAIVQRVRGGVTTYYFVSATNTGPTFQPGGSVTFDCQVGDQISWAIIAGGVSATLIPMSAEGYANAPEAMGYRICGLH